MFTLKTVRSVLSTQVSNASGKGSNEDLLHEIIRAWGWLIDFEKFRPGGLPLMLRVIDGLATLGLSFDQLMRRPP